MGRMVEGSCIGAIAMTEPGAGRWVLGVGGWKKSGVKYTKDTKTTIQKIQYIDISILFHCISSH